MTHTEEKHLKAIELTQKLGITIDAKKITKIILELNKLGYYWFPSLRVWKKLGE